MIRAHIITEWMQNLEIYRPKILDHYSFITWTDATAQPTENLMPNPNMFVIVAIMDDAVFSALEADPRYEILISEEYINAN